jgi:hypothetical protein
VIFDEHVKTRGDGLLCTTVTVNPQLVRTKQLSLAVHVTGVVPIGKKLPLGGEQLTVTGLQPPVAELL